MANYNSITPEIIEKIKNIVGEKNLTVDHDKLENYSHDEVTEQVYYHMPDMVSFPQTAEQIAEIVKLANLEHIPVVPRGAGTGLACGAVPVYGGIVLTTEKMNKILKVDAENMYMIVEPGVRTEDVQNAAREKGLYYPGDPCSGDSCFIGGNVATNAGGNKAVKYGTSRQLVYSMDVVTPKGEITILGTRFSINSTGYALEQLVIGSEGTLAIITKITLKLKPLPQNVMDLLAVFPTVKSAIDTVLKFQREGVIPTCLEFLESSAVRSIEKYLNEKLPHDDGNYLIIQIESDTEEQLDDMVVKIDEICTENGAMETLVADSKKIWEARKAANDAFRDESLINSNEDIVVPLDKLPMATEKMAEICKKNNAMSRLAAHAGDGNMHFVILKGNIPDDQWEGKLDQIHKEIYDIIYPMGGRISGEHGIGSKKRSLMEHYTDPVELSLMQAIKKAWDPNLILNPGTLFDV